MPSISWSQIDTNKNSIGYLDSTEVENARKKGINNVFTGMIQEDYEGNIDVDKLIEKYDKGSRGRIPMIISDDRRQIIADMYRELVVLQHKYNNLETEMKEKFDILDDIKQFFSKKFKIGKENPEYNKYKSDLNDLKLKVINKEDELATYIDEQLYRKVYTKPGKEIIIAMNV